MTYEEDWNTAAEMRRTGGSFVRCLGELWQHADPDNKRIIKNTWKKYWEEYAALAKKKKREE